VATRGLQCVLASCGLCSCQTTHERAQRGRHRWMHDCNDDSSQTACSAQQPLQARARGSSGPRESRTKLYTEAVNPADHQQVLNNPEEAAHGHWPNHTAQLLEPDTTTGDTRAQQTAPKHAAQATCSTVRHAWRHRHAQQQRACHQQRDCTTPIHERAQQRRVAVDLDRQAASPNCSKVSRLPSQTLALGNAKHEGKHLPCDLSPHSTTIESCQTAVHPHSNRHSHDKQGRSVESVLLTDRGAHHMQSLSSLMPAPVDDHMRALD
jgi:hypothetical protein